MFLIQKPLFFWIETPLHAGSGSDLGIVDLPIQRERHTGFPKIEGSGIKGCLRESFVNKLGKDNTELKLAYGPEGADDAHAGSLGFSDARLLLFPVKSVRGVFAWITCPQVIIRFKRDIALCSVANYFDVPSVKTVPYGCELFVQNDKIVLEEYTFTAHPDNSSGSTTKFALWLKEHVAKRAESYWQNKIEKNILVLPDDDFKDFVTMFTEVIARTKIDDNTGTVERGALWYEEYLPTDSILYSLVFAAPVYQEKEEEKGKFTIDESDAEDKKALDGGKKKTEIEAQKVMNFFKGNLPSVLQIGGNATIGKGFVRVVFLGCKERGVNNGE
jgi:CRISPR-associated protein Cmr4